MDYFNNAFCQLNPGEGLGRLLADWHQEAPTPCRIVSVVVSFIGVRTRLSVYGTVYRRCSWTVSDLAA
jgi:hypothetical protein